MTKDKFIEYYQKDKVTGSYDEQREGTEYRKEKRRKELKIFLDLLDKKENDKVLELGCSSGFLTEHLGKVTAIDTSKKMLKIAKKKNPEARVVEADMFKLPFKKNSFDKVVTMRVWNHLNKLELEQALIEVRRVLKPKGIVVFDFEEKHFIRRFINFFYKKIFGIKGFKVYQYSIEEIFEILQNVNFRIERTTILNHKIGCQIMVKGRKLK